MKTVIVAAGLGTRLQKYTKDVIPKILLSTGERPLLIDILEFWSPYSEELIVITHEKYSCLIKEYSKIYGFNVTIKIHNESDGSANAIMSTITDPGDYLFTWSDIVPSTSNFKEPNETTIFISPGEYRYVACKQLVSEVKPGNRGNVPGIYYIKDFKNIGLNPENKDFVELFNEEYSFTVEPLPVIDYGDAKKYEEALNLEKAKVRFFNSLEVQSNYVVKRPTNDHGKKLAEIEKEWYQNIVNHKVINHIIPKVTLNDDSIVLERLNKTVSEYITETGDLSIIYSVYELLDNLHKFSVPASIDTKTNDIKVETKEKLIKRFDEIKFVLSCKSDYVTIDNLVDYIEFLYNELLNVYSGLTNYTLIHGDPQFSNIMLDDNGNLKLIDPRGYFGTTKNYGLREYDFAKVLYAIYGYDTFNNTLPYVQGTGFKPIDNVEKHIKYITNNYDVNEYALRLWLGVILLGLPGYIKNDVQKLLDSTKEAIKYMETLT